MKKTIPTCVLSLLILFPIFSQNIDYSVLSIPDSLTENANAVVQLENTAIEILSSSKMVIQKNAVITVLNKLGDEDAYISLYYDKDIKIKDFGAKVYDAFGREIKKIKDNDLTDISAADGFSLYRDDRLKYYHHVPISYPYTIVYQYEITTPNTATIPKWLPIHYYSASTVKSNYTLKYPADIAIHFKEKNLDAYIVKNESSGNVFSYTLSNAPAVRFESYSPYFLDYGPQVLFAANKFHLSGVDGQADNWNEFGKWIYQELLANRDQLPQSTVQEIKALVKDTQDTKEKARLIYNYMQYKTRYVSIQIGIGGWKPMTALEVDKLGYGDCKALTNYTHSLLKAAGVNSMYTVIYADEKKNIDSELASIQGNHAILMVPTKKDTIWLECTNQKVPFGYLGKFTDDRDALVVSPEGGKIIHTKSYSDKENKQVISAEYFLDENGNISASANIESSGTQYENHHYIADLNPKDKDIYYKKFFDGINNIRINKIAHENNDREVTFTENITFSADNYAVQSGERMLVRLNAFNLYLDIPKRIQNRKLPFEIKAGFLDKDSVIINLPKSFTIEALASNKNIETKFGTYKITIEKLDDHQLKYQRELLIKQDLYTVDDYEEYRKFQKKINQNDNAKIVLIKNQNHEN